MSGNINNIIAFNYFGGKLTWLKYIYSQFPANFNHLIDLFAGSLAVSLNYKGKIIRTANEINTDITNFFKVLRDHEAELTKLLLLTPCSESEYNNSWTFSGDKIEQARRFYVRCRQSFNGLGCQRKNKGWQMAKTEVRANTGETVSKYNNGIEKLHEVAEIIRANFQIMNMDYLDCIDRIDFPKAFFYCDPPYPKETRGSFNDYKYEFTTENHIQLADRLHNIEGLAMVSSYKSKLYDRLYKDWRKVKFPIKKNNIRKKYVQEVIWMNYPESKNLFNN